jgi:hypothetical protein
MIQPFRRLSGEALAWGCAGVGGLVMIGLAAAAVAGVDPVASMPPVIRAVIVNLAEALVVVGAVGAETRIALADERWAMIRIIRDAVAVERRREPAVVQPDVVRQVAAEVGRQVTAEMAGMREDLAAVVREVARQRGAVRDLQAGVDELRAARSAPSLEMDIDPEAVEAARAVARKLLAAEGW